MDSDNRVSARPGREELEGRVRSLEATLEEDADRHRRALREAVGTKDELAAEAQTLRAREGKWAQEATELSRALSEAELQRDRAEHQAEEEACERAALDIQVNELRALLRRSRDAIEAIRLCETEADTSTGRTTVAASATTTTAPAGVAATNPDSCTLATATQGGVMPGNTLPSAASARVSTACLPRDRQAWSAAAPFHTSGDSIVFWEDGGLSPYAQGQAWAEPRSGDLVPIVRRQQPGFPSRSLAGVVAMDSKKLRVTRAGTAATAAGRGSGYWSEGHVVRSTVAVERPSSTGGSGVFSVFGSAAVARREDPWDTEVALRDGVLWKRGSGVGAARDRQTSKHRGGGDSPSESDGQNEDSSDEGSSAGERGRYKRSSSMKASRAENRRARRRAKSKERHAAAVTKRAEMAERLLAEERRAMTRELEAERARFREKEEERHRERQEDRARREKEEVEAMRRRLADEEARAAAATTAATAAAAERQRRTLREEVDRQERERREKQEQLVTAEKRLGQNRSWLRKDREIPTGDVGEGLRVLTTTTTTDVTSAVHPVADENSEGLRVKEKDFVRCDRNDDGPSHRKSEQKSPRGGPFPAALLREVAPVPGAPVSAVEQAPDSSVPSVCFADPSAATDSVIVPPTASTTHSPAIKSATVPRSAVASVVDPSALHAAVASVSATDASMNERNDDGVCGPAAADLPLTGNDSAKTSTSTAAPAAVTFNAAEETKEGKSGDSVGLPGVEEVIKEREGGLLGSSAPGTSVERKNSSGDGGSDAMRNVISGQTAVLEAPEETQRAQADREVREYREKIRERRQQQQQQQHKATSIARYASSSSPADSDHDFETEHSALRAGKPSARGDSDGEDLAKAEMESDSGAASGVGGGEGSGLSVGRSVNSVSGGSDSDWF